MHAALKLIFVIAASVAMLPILNAAIETTGDKSAVWIAVFTFVFVASVIAGVAL